MPYPLALALTFAVEVPVYGFALHLTRLAPGWRAWGGAVGVNLVTHPIVWAALRPDEAGDPGAGAGVLAFALVEIAAWVVEAALVWLWVRSRLRGRHARGVLLVSLIALVANSGSCLAGLVLAFVRS